MSVDPPDSTRAPRPRLWERSSLRVKGLMLIAIPMLPLLALMSTLMLQAREDKRADERITELRQARDATERLLATAVDAETGIRGYVATGNAEFLEPFDGAMANLIGLAQTLREARVSSEVQTLLQEQYELLLGLRRQGPALSAPLRADLLLRGKENMDSLREALASHRDAQQANLAAALEERDGLHRRTQVLLWAGAIAGLVGGATGVFLFVREIAARVRRLQENSRLLGGSEPLAEVRGNDEIATLGRVLEATRQELAHRESLRREAEDEMIRSRDEAERANTAKSEFLSRMSHELRTPLNAILGFAQLLEMDSLNADQRDNVHQIVRGGNHLLDLINEVLDISRVETGRLSISVEPIALKPLIDETVALVRPLAVAEGIELRASSGPGMEHQHVMADAQRLKQIVLNLLSNAIKYNRPGGSIDLVVNDVDETVSIEVRDTGRGLGEEQLAHLFTPFDRLGAERSEVEGTGLGLALSKGLAEAMGAGIRVSSEVGAGTTFFLDLAKGDDPAESVPRDDLEKVAAAATRAQIRAVLYVEDNLSNLALVESILAHRPHVRLLTATDGRAGIDLALGHRPDLILLDVNLPDVDGGEVLQILRDDPRTSSIPVVIVSADATERQIASFKGAGALDYVTKPLDVTRFLRVVDRALAEAVA